MLRLIYQNDIKYIIIITLSKRYSKFDSRTLPALGTRKQSGYGTERDEQQKQDREVDASSNFRQLPTGPQPVRLVRPK